MKIDWKYFISAISLLVALLIAGIIQLNPPADTPLSKQPSNIAAKFITVDQFCEEVVRGVPGTKDTLLHFLRQVNLKDDAALWENAGETP